MVKHLRNFHCEVQTLCGLEADVAHGTVTQAAAETQAATQVTQAVDVWDGRQAAGVTAAQGRAQRPAAVATPPDAGPQAVQGMAEEAGQQDCSAKVSEEKSERTSTVSPMQRHFITLMTLHDGRVHHWLLWQEVLELGPGKEGKKNKSFISVPSPSGATLTFGCFKLSCVLLSDVADGVALYPVQVSEEDGKR